MMKIFLLIGLSCSSFSLGGEARESYVRFTPEVGNNSYYSYDLQNQIGLGEVWALTSDLSLLRPEPNDNSTQVKLGADILANESLDLFLRGVYRWEPDSVRASGGELGTDWTLSDLWEGTLLSVLKPTFSWTRYHSDPGSLRRSRNDLVQYGFDLGFDQDLAKFLTVGVNVSRFFYSVSNQRLRTIADSLKIRSMGSVGLVTGFAESVFGFHTKWRFLKEWSLDLPITFTKNIVTDETNTAFAPLLLWRFTHQWTFGLKSSVSKENGQPTITTYGVQFEYLF